MSRAVLLLSLVITSASAFGSVHFGETTTEVKLRSKPTRQAWSPETLARGTKLLVVDCDSGWCYVRVIGTDLAGWVHGDYVMLGPAHSKVVVHNAVLQALPEFAQFLSRARVPIAEWVGDRYDIFDKLIIAFGRGASLEDLKSAIDATGPDPSVYLAPMANEEMNGTIVIGANVGYGQKVAIVKDLYGSLGSVANADDLADAIYAKGKPIRP